ncbi:unnamed protein product [Mesocestoides corti]|uniref:Uncharacterized protein n=1 Tax=Mesocestoides corti TaxID=53468 RepID=A0A0R3UFE3_MESCO|nr:unnamed protein product [Mesocestoides corti]
MATPGSEGQPQIQIGTPSQIQQSQMQPQMQPQIIGQPLIRHAMPVQMAQASNVVRMQPAGIRQRPQMAKPGQMTADQPIPTYVGGQNRMPAGGQMPQQLHVISQGVFQSQQPQPTYMTSDGSHTMQAGVVEQHRPIVTSYGQQGNVHLSTMPIFQVGAPGVQQPVYNATMRVAGASGQPPISTPNGPIRFVSNNGGASVMQLVTQQNQVQVNQPHFIPAETQPRMVVPQSRPAGPSLKIIPSPQQPPQGQAIRPAMSLMQQGQQPCLSSGGSQGPQVPATSAVGPATPEQQQHQQQQVYRKFTERYLQVVESAIQHVRLRQPDADLKSYYKFKAFLEEDNLPPQNLGKVDMLIRQLQQDPFHLLKKGISQQQRQQQQQQQGVGGNGGVSEETRQKLVGQKRTIQPQRLMPAGIRPAMATSSSLNSLLSQPVDPLGATPGPFPGQMPQAAAAAARHMQQQHQLHQQQHQNRLMITQQQQQQQQQHQMMVSAEQVHQSPVDPFQAALDKLADDFVMLEKQVGKERFNRAISEISDETRSLRELTGHVLPRDIFPTPPLEETKVENPRAESESLLGHKRSGDVEPEADSGVKKHRTIDDQVDALGSNEQLLCDGKSITDRNLTIDDVSVKVRQEFEKIKTVLQKIDISLAHPDSTEGYPSMQDMENHMTCQDVSEWNNSLHLKLEYNDKLMPCVLPPLYTRLPPDYLTSRRASWFVRMDDFAPPEVSSDDGKVSFFTREEVASFLKTSSTLIAWYMKSLRNIPISQHLGERLSLYNVAEVWVKSILMAITRCMNAF